jgi:quinol-cytochrome oxidoreductase complex cytochrome b subunit/mono/diheme cytochrome c family protein
MKAEAGTNSRAPLLARVARRTTLGDAFRNLIDGRPSGFSAWARTTAGPVALLLLLQIFTGVLLAFYYVPSAESARVTVAFVEKEVGGGSWVRALHLYASQLLPLALLLHLAQSFARGAHRRRPCGWLAALLLLALVLLNGATGYSLPWDARAFYSTRVAESLAAGLPLVGGFARAWLVGGEEISTLTLSRLSALHVLVIPALLLLVVFARLFVFKEPATGAGAAPGRDLSWLPAQLARQAVVAGAVFAGLAFYAARFPAPLGPPAEEAAPGYLPRPGAQFLWLFQLLKYFNSTNASLVAVFLPALLLAALALLPFLPERGNGPAGLNRTRAVGVTVFALLFLVVAFFTTLAYVEDRRDPRVREQLARQARQEEEFRRAPFVPQRTGGGRNDARADSPSSATPPGPAVTQNAPPPEAYARHCAKCHGAGGEGKSVNPSLVGVSARPGRTVEDIVAILNDPRSYNLERRMPSFARKLTEEEKRAVAEWVASLK